jgi:hypothetical protein
VSVSALKERPVIWEPLPGPQTQFLAETARECLIGGSVGGGKTDSVIMSAVSQTGNKNHRALILRKTIPQLRDVVARSHELFLPLGATFNKQESVFTFPSGARVELGFLDAPEDMYRYMGRAFSCICWEELTSWSGDATDNEGQPVSGSYIYMTSRLRSTDPSLRLEIRASCTPGGIGASWVQNRFGIPADGSSSEVIDKATGYRRRFIRATIADNKYLANTAYARSLESLPAAQRRALVEGRWDSYEGQVFAEWNHARHTCDEFEIPDSWEMWRGLDFGTASPACCLWAAHDPARDIIFICDEVYGRGLLVSELALAIREIDDVYGGGLEGVADSSCWADVGLGNEAGKGSPGDVLNKYGLNFKPAAKGSGSRVAGVSLLHARMAIKPQGYPGLVIFRRCRNLIREIPALVYSRTNVEDVDSECSDHAYDALRYLLGRKKTSFWKSKVRGL